MKQKSHIYKYLFFAIAAAVFFPVSGGNDNKEKVSGWLTASIADTGRCDDQFLREKQLTSILDELAKESGILAVETSDFADEVSKIIRTSGINPAKAASLQLKAEELKRRAARVAALTVTPETSNQQVLQSCRIIAVNPALKLVAIAAGRRHGVFSGMLFHTIAPAPAVSIRITQPLSGVSSAEVIKGNFNQLAPGMSVSAIQSTRQQQ